MFGIYTSAMILEHLLGVNAREKFAHYVIIGISVSVIVWLLEVQLLSAHCCTC